MHNWYFLLCLLLGKSHAPSCVVFHLFFPFGSNEWRSEGDIIGERRTDCRWECAIISYFCRNCSMVKMHLDCTLLSHFFEAAGGTYGSLVSVRRNPKTCLSLFKSMLFHFCWEHRNIYTINWLGGLRQTTISFPSVPDLTPICEDWSTLQNYLHNECEVLYYLVAIGFLFIYLNLMAAFGPNFSSTDYQQ